MTDSYFLWKNDIEHRFSPTSLTDALTNSIYVATAIIGGVTTNSGDKTSQWDAYLDLRNKLLDVSEFDGAAILPKGTTAELVVLTGIIDGRGVQNITTANLNICLGGVWVKPGSETGPIVHLPVAEITTTDNTQTSINTQTLDANSVYEVTSEVLACLPDHSTTASFNIVTTVKRLSTGGAILVGAISIMHSAKDSGGSSWDATFTVSGNDVRVSVTGANGTSITWKSKFDYLKHS